MRSPELGQAEKMASGVLGRFSGIPVTSFASPRACGELPQWFPQLHGPPGDFLHSEPKPMGRSIQKHTSSGHQLTAALPSRAPAWPS